MICIARKEKASRKTNILWIFFAIAMLIVVGSCTQSDSNTPLKKLTGYLKWEFAQTPNGNLPDGWVGFQTNPTEAWVAHKIVDDPSAPSPPAVLSVVESTCSGNTYNMALHGRSSYRDLDISIMVKAVGGEEDQGGGPIWRCRDQNNYYICRFNPLENNFRVYYVKDSKRQQLASANIELQAGKWYHVRVTMRGNHIVCYLDGKELLNVNDETIATAGFVGVWTKADATTSFDDMIIQPLN